MLTSTRIKIFTKKKEKEKQKISLEGSLNSIRIIVNLMTDLIQCIQDKKIQLPRTRFRNYCKNILFLLKEQKKLLI